MRRYYSAKPIDGNAVRLDDAEAHHLLHVARVEPGDRVILFDGTGREFSAEVVDCRRTAVELSIHDCREVCRELGYKLTVGVPLPKGDRARYLIEKLTELGVTRLVPLTTERSMPARSKEEKKLSRYVIEASKQCGRNVLMDLACRSAWETFVAASTGVRLAAHPGGSPPLDQVGQLPEAITIAFGPEGGLTDEEIRQAEAAGWKTIDLGSRILRIETAAVAVVSALTLSRPMRAEEPS